MKILVVLGAILFSGGAGLVIFNWIRDIHHYSELSWEIMFIAILLMVIPIVALISWVLWKIIKKL